MSIQTKPVDWDFIVKTIQRQRCILFLGPELFRTNDNNSSKQQVFFKTLADENPDKIVSYNDNGFFLFSSPQDETRIFLKIIDFFESQGDDEIIKKIAEIPFHTIVSINPDSLLKKYFEQHNYPHSFEFFDKANKKDIAESPSIEKPLLYNLFGSIVKGDTLILTHEDLFEYFRAIMGNNVLPLELRTVLESALDYIFLGFQFDKWYIQLILSLLKLHDEKYHFIRYASANAINNDTESLCINHFKIEFIRTDNDSFLNTLHDKCKEAGILRDFSSVNSTHVYNELSEVKDEGITHLKERIERQYRLLSEFERKLDTETNPRVIMGYEDEIENIKKQIAQYEKELESNLQVQS